MQDPRDDGRRAAVRSLVMGILNVTPDSFSDGGRHGATDVAVRHGLAMAADGADIVDVGGESTRPGAHRVPESEERRRVLPVVRELAAAGVRVSVDTTRAAVAAAALEAGASIVNDVSGGLADPCMAGLVAEAGVLFVAMHWRGPSRGMAAHAHYGDVVTDVVRELRARLDALVDAGVDERRIVLDPGLGFAKTARHDWELLAGLDHLRGLGRPVLVGASRKSFLGRLVQRPGEDPLPPRLRDHLTCAVSALAAEHGAWCIRAHDVVSTRHAVAVAQAVAAARAGAGTRPVALPWGSNPPGAQGWVAPGLRS